MFTLFPEGRLLSASLICVLFNTYSHDSLSLTKHTLLVDSYVHFMNLYLSHWLLPKETVMTEAHFTFMTIISNFIVQTILWNPLNGYGSSLEDLSHPSSAWMIISHHSSETKQMHVPSKIRSYIHTLSHLVHLGKVTLLRWSLADPLCFEVHLFLPVSGPSSCCHITFLSQS